jgi:hypothetical protein
MAGELNQECIPHYGLGQAGGVLATPTPYPKFNRQRMVELVKIANDVLALAEDKGVKKEERCRFGQLCQSLWQE